MIMKKFLLSLMLLAGMLTAAYADSGLHFRKDGTFKIVQFTDTHIIGLPGSGSEVAIQVIQETVAAEKPDLIIMTGDIVTGEPAEPCWEMLLSCLKEIGLPFIVLNGNHDTEQDMEYDRFTSMIVSTPGSLNRRNRQGELADLAVEVKSRNGRVGTVLYCLDSHANCFYPGIGGYAWITGDQIEWYRKMSDKFTSRNGGKPVNGLAFFHIPLQEYTAAYNEGKGPRSGIRLEHECPSDINSGLFRAILEQGDVMATFTGHDHDNDYIAPYKGIYLGYGRFSGGKTTYIDLMPGARLITLYENQRRFTSYIRLKDGRIIDNFASDSEIAVPAPVFDGNCWMEEVDGMIPICRMSIPASHDSGAMVPEEMMQTQDRTIAAQLAAGIRGFDIRLMPMRSKKLGVFHGPVYQNITWEDDVLPEFIRFLENHPSEALIVSLKNEGAASDYYVQYLANTLGKEEYQKYFVEDFDAALTLEDCRGKILFIHRDETGEIYPGAYVQGWGDNCASEMSLVDRKHGGSATVMLQDEYLFRYAGKAPFKSQIVLKNLMTALAESPASTKWAVTFASATAAPYDSPASFAEIVNHAVWHELQGLDGGCGIVFLDFTGSEHGSILVRKLIEMNLQ